MDEVQEEGYAMGRSRMVSLCSVYKGKHHKVEKNPFKKCMGTVFLSRVLS